MSTEKATANELFQFRSLAGTLIYLGNGVISLAALVLSLMQQRIANLKVADLIEANNMIGDLRNLIPRIAYKYIQRVTDVRLCNFADAAHPTDRDYGQTRLILGLCLWNDFDRKQWFYPIDWSLHKQNGFFTRHTALKYLLPNP